MIPVALSLLAIVVVALAVALVSARRRMRAAELAHERLAAQLEGFARKFGRTVEECLSTPGFRLTKDDERKRKTPQPKPEEPANGSVLDLSRKQILVVDCEAASLDFTAELLRQYGARVTIARSAAEAILALHQHHDLVVTDNAVPVTEGVMLAQQLRQANGGLPAIVLRKPVDANELASEVAQVLTRSGEH